MRLLRNSQLLLRVKGFKPAASYLWKAIQL